MQDCIIWDRPYSFIEHTKNITKYEEKGALNNIKA